MTSASRAAILLPGWRWNYHENLGKTDGEAGIAGLPRSSFQSPVRIRSTSCFTVGVKLFE